MKIFLIILLSIIIFQWLLRRLTPYILLYAVKHITKKQFGKAQAQTQKKESTNIHRTTTTEKKIDKNIGEYVEFEEIK